MWGKGSIYLRLCQRKEPIRLHVLIRNIGFLIKTVPTSAKKAEMHLNRTIAITKEIGAKNLLGQAYLDLGRLCQLKKHTERARKCVAEASKIFEACDATVYLKQAEDLQKELN